MRVQPKQFKDLAVGDMVFISEITSGPTFPISDIVVRRQENEILLLELNSKDFDMNINIGEADVYQAQVNIGERKFILATSPSAVIMGLKQWIARQ